MSARALVLGSLGVAIVALVIVRMLDEYELRRDQREQAEEDAERVRRALAAVNRRSLGEPSASCHRAGSIADFRRIVS